MRPSKYSYGAWVLGLIVIGEILLWHRSSRVLVIALPYLMIAALMSGLCVLYLGGYRSQHNYDFSQRPASSSIIAPPILFWTAVQMAVLGTLNVFDFQRNETGSTLRMGISYSVVVVFFVACYRLLAIAEQPKQAGGYIPVMFFGFPRSRKFLFTAFGGFVNCFVLTIMSFEVSLAEHGWAPHALMAPTASLLMVTIMSFMTVMFIASRHRHALGRSSTLERFIIVFAILFLIGVGFIELYLDRAYYVYVLDGVTVLACALSNSYLSRARTVAAL